MKRPYTYDKNHTPLYKQRQVVRNYLMTEGRTITQMECTYMFGFTRLSAIIFCIKEDLLADGGDFEVKTEYIMVENRHGGMSRVASYSIVRSNGK